MSFQEEILELLTEIKRRLVVYGKNDTEGTIRIICEGIDNFIQRHSLEK